MLLPVELLIFLGVWISSRIIIGWWNSLGKEGSHYPPSIPSIYLFGSLPFLRGFNNIADYFMRKADELGPIFSFSAGNKFVLVLNGREVIEDALINHSSAFSGRTPVYTETLANPKSRGVINMNTTPEWKKYHQLILSILKEFGFGVRSMMESRILTEFESLTDYLLRQNGESFNPREIVHLCTTNIIMSIIFGRRHDYNLGISELASQIKRAFDNLDLSLNVAPLLRFLPFHRHKLREQIESQKMMRKIIEIETSRSLEDGAKDCFVRSYIERVGEDHDAEQLTFILRDLVVAGTDTTANALLWTLIALANHPDVQNRLRAGIDAIVPRGRFPSMSDQLKLPFVEATTMEIMRWKTLVPMSLPHMTLSDTDVGDYHIPGESLVLTNLYAAHMDPKIWKDPEIFRPDRFLNEDGDVVGKDSVIPFSLGRRSCLGEVLARSELFLILTGLVQRFYIRPPDGQNFIDDKPIEPITFLLTSSEFNVRLIARD